MNSIHEYYDRIADISVTTKEAVESVKAAKAKVQEALIAINALKKEGDVSISPVSSVTTKDVHRNLLFFELLINQVFGLIQASEIQELLELTNYCLTDRGEF